MVQIARGKALVAKLAATPGVRDAEALAASLGHGAKLRRAAKKLTPKQRAFFERIASGKGGDAGKAALKDKGERGNLARFASKNPKAAKKLFAKKEAKKKTLVKNDAAPKKPDPVDKYDTTAEEARMRRRIEADGEKFGWSKERIQNSVSNKVKDIRSQAAQRKLNDQLEERIANRPRTGRYARQLEEARKTGKPVKISGGMGEDMSYKATYAMPDGSIKDSRNAAHLEGRKQGMSSQTRQGGGTPSPSSSLPKITSGSEKQNKFAQDVRARYVKTLDGIYKMWKINPGLPDEYKNHSFDQFLDTIAGGKALKKLISEKDAKFWIDTVRGREKSMAQIQDLLKNEKFKSRYGGD